MRSATPSTGKNVAADADEICEAGCGSMHLREIISAPPGSPALDDALRPEVRP